MVDCSKKRVGIITIGILVFAAIVVPLIYLTSTQKNRDDTPGEKPHTEPTNKIPERLEQRIDCYPESLGGHDKVTKAKCESRNCIYHDSGDSKVPSCIFPLHSEYGFSVVGDREETEYGFKYNLRQQGKVPFNSPSFKSPVFEVHTIDENVIRFKFDDSSNTRYKVPMKLNLPSTKVTRETAYEVKVTDRQNFAFQIKRKSNNKVIWDTTVGGLTLLDQFLQISTALPSHNIYGFGENLHWSFRHDLNYQTWPMFSRDQAPFWQNKTNLYGVHPFYTCVEDDGNTHGVLLLNSNAQDYSLTPLPMLTYRTIGGILDFYVFMGPTPENVIQKYTEVIGRPFMPPYWALGFQLCRYGYKNIDDLKGAVERTKQFGIPHDVQYADIDHMEEEKVFTIDNVKFKGLNDTFISLREGGMRTMIILDPCFITTENNYEPYDELKKVNGAVMWAPNGGRADNKDTDGAMLGYVWPNGKVVFPDFFKNKTKELWKRLIVKHRKELVVDGMWIDMNEPANFGTNELKPFNWPVNNTDYWSLKCDTSKYDDPPYRTMAAYVYDTDKKKGRLSDKTLCMVGRQGDDNHMMHYNTHSLFGWSQSEPTLQGMREATGDRSMVLSRSTFPGSGKYAGHWLGDNDSSWPGLHTSIIGMLEFGLFGIPYIGADICGFFGNSTAELCKRWMQLGAFYPFSRNHNGIGFSNQDPGAFGEEVATASREALETRYRFLPYLYTLFHNAHVHGNTVARPLHHEFPRDNVTLGIDTQFMWGRSLLISPILFEKQENLTYYLPAGRWYNYNSGNFTDGPKHETIKINTNSKIPLHIRGGSILPMQEAARNTTYSRKNPVTLMVVLDKFDTEGGMAEGELFWDDGISTDTYENGKFLLMKFRASANILSMEIAAGSPLEGENLILNAITISGVKREVKTVKLLDTMETITTFFNTKMNILRINNLSLPLNESFRIMWQDTTDEEKSRLDCYPERLGGFDLVTEAKCRQRNCVYNKTDSNGPDCYFRTNQGYYQLGILANDSSGFNVSLQWTGEEPFFGILEKLKFSVEFRGENVVRFKFSDPTNPRYEVPVPTDLPSKSGTNRKYEVNITSTDPFHFQIIRKSTGTVLWDTSVGGLIFEDQFLQIATKLPSYNVYGFGENVHDSFRHNLNWKTWPMFSRDQPTGGVNGENHYGVHPFYTCLENDGNSHGVLLMNSNAQDYSFTPLPMLTYRTIGGVLDFYMFLGPEPESVVQQYTGVIGRPYLPPYWSLGFQLCRYGYNNLTALKAAVDRTKEAKIPHDIQYADIDHMHEQMDFTVDNVNFKGLGDYFRSIQNGGMHTIIILDPALITTVKGYKPYDYMKAVDGNIKWPDNYDIPADMKDTDGALLGYVWPTDKVIFPDFFKSQTAEVWKNLTVTHHKEIPFDGLWIDMNEPANFDTNKEKPWNWPKDRLPYWNLKCKYGDILEDPPYRTMAAYQYDYGKQANRLSDKTVCMVARQGPNGIYKHYDVHSLYGWSQSLPTLEALQSATGKRGIVISRSTFPGSGKHVGHWLGDNASNWPNVRLSIIGLLEFNLFGIPYIGADICGFFDNTNPELCKRWMQLGAFYTFSRNHNGLNNIPQDPAALGQEVADASREALNTRYWLLPYLYTLFYHAHSKGNTVIRPLHHEFRMDKNTYGIDKQFLWGPALLICPILEQGQTVLNLYLPKSRWFDFYTGELVTEKGGAGHQISVTPDSKIPLFVQGGHIIPLQQPANNTVFSRKNTFKLIVALAKTGNSYSASGDLFWDDGDSIDTTNSNNHYYSTIEFGGNVLKMTIGNSGNAAVVSNLKIDLIDILGYDGKSSNAALNSQSLTTSYERKTNVLSLKDLNLPLSQNFSILFS